MCFLRRGDAIRTRVVASKKELHVADREKSRRLEELRRYPGCHRTWSKTLESLANPLDSLRVRLQAALRSVAERASALGVLLVDYSKPGSTHSSQQMVSLPVLNN